MATPARRAVKEYGRLPVIDPKTRRINVAVGIDQSYTGFAMTVMSSDGEVFRSRVYKAPHTGIERLRDIWRWLEQEFADLERSGFLVRDVAVESPVRMSHSALISGELWAVVRLVCLTTLTGPGKYPLQVAPASLKKFITGKGTGVQKNQILLNVYKKWSIEFDDDNAADSYGLARIAARLGDTTYEREVLARLQDHKYRDTPT